MRNRAGHRTWGRVWAVGVWLCSVWALWGVAPAWAHEEQPLPLRTVGFTQRLNAQVPRDLVFRDETGTAVRLGDYVGAKPVILTLAYYQCRTLCPFVLDGLLESLRALSFDIGRQFSVVTVSIDPRDTATVAAAKKAAYLQRYSRPGAGEGWHFLTGEPEAIEQLTQAVGFRYAYDAATDQYAHATGMLILTPAGNIARYFYGIQYAPRELRLSLVEAAAHTIGSPVDELLLFCYRYDPVTGTYGVAIMQIIRLAALVTVVALGGFIGVMVRRDRRNVSADGRGVM